MQNIITMRYVNRRKDHLVMIFDRCKKVRVCFRSRDQLDDNFVDSIKLSN